MKTIQKYRQKIKQKTNITQKKQKKKMKRAKRWIKIYNVQKKWQQKIARLIEIKFSKDTNNTVTLHYFLLADHAT